MSVLPAAVEASDSETGLLKIKIKIKIKMKIIKPAAVEASDSETGLFVASTGDSWAEAEEALVKNKSINNGGKQKTKVESLLRRRRRRWQKISQVSAFYGKKKHK